MVETMPPCQAKEQVNGLLSPHLNLWWIKILILLWIFSHPFFST